MTVATTKSELQASKPTSESSYHIVTDTQVARAILDAISDEFSSKIINSTISKGLSMAEISSANQIQMATVYRRVSELLEGGLLVIERIVIMETGQKYPVFRSTFRDVNIKSESGKMEVKVAPNNHYTPSGIAPKSSAHMEEVVTRDSSPTSSSILSALGDEFSRRILASAIAGGMTVKEISTEQNISLSTCYEKVRQLVDDGMMILERTVVTRTGRRYGVYRTSFSDATIKFSPGGIQVETKPNSAVLGRLHDAWLSSTLRAEHEKRRTDS